VRENELYLRYANRLDPGQLPNLFATQFIIPHQKQEEFQGFEKQTTLDLFLDNYPAFKGFKTNYL